MASPEDTVTDISEITHPALLTRTATRFKLCIQSANNLLHNNQQVTQLVTYIHIVLSPSITKNRHWTFKNVITSCKDYDWKVKIHIQEPRISIPFAMLFYVYIYRWAITLNFFFFWPIFLKFITKKKNHTRPLKFT